MASRQELMKTIDEQQKKFEKLSAKFKDVVSAYRGVVAEKEALSASLNALQTNSEVTKTEKPSENDDSTEAESPESQIAEGPDALTTLRQSITTITQEKLRVETTFQSDRKKLLAELEFVKNENVTQLQEAEKQRKLLEQQLNEMRANLRQRQCERECEQSDQGAMLKELQHKLAQERLQTEHLQIQLSNLQKELQQAQEGPNDLVMELTEQISKLRSDLAKKEHEERQFPRNNELEQEMSELKIQHMNALKQEQDRAFEVESRFSKLTKRAEERVSSMEARISDLSSSLGDYEKKKQQDLSVIDKLKSRISQLNQENTVLSQASAQNEDQTLTKLLENLKLIVDKVKHQSPAGINFYELLELESPEAENAHQPCRQKYETLQDEFEKYKLRAQAVLKHKQKESNTSDSDNDDHLRSVIASLHGKLQESERKLTENEKNYQDIVNGLRHSIAELRSNNEIEITDIRSKCQQQIREIEQEMHKQRERTLEVLAEKEKELDTMRLIMAALRAQSAPPAVPADPAVHLSPELPSRLSFDREKSPSIRSSVDRPTSGGHSPLGLPESTNVYYVQEMSKKDKEMNHLRKNTREIEGAMRELQHSSITKELQHYEMNEKLKEEIRVLESKLKLYQEDANVEYLKNVLLQYLMCDSPTGRQHMLKAISVLLKLSNKEVEILKKQNEKWFHFWGNK